MSKEEAPSLAHKIRSLIIGTVLVGAGALLIIVPLNNDRTVFRIGGGQTFIIEVADESEERAQGLSGRDSLGVNDGMLFAFDEPGVYPFSMRGMKFPLDFVWLDENKTVVEITNDVPNGLTPPANVIPQQEIKYILEVNAGIAAEQGWEVGQQAEFRIN